MTPRKKSTTVSGVKPAGSCLSDKLHPANIALGVRYDRSCILDRCYTSADEEVNISQHRPEVLVNRAETTAYLNSNSATADLFSRVPASAVREANGIGSLLGTNGDNGNITISMPNINSSSTDTKRASIACHKCRHNKLKCSGTKPCDRCARMGRDCTYDEPFHQDPDPGPVRSKEHVRSTTAQHTPNKRPRLNSDIHSQPRLPHQPTLPSLQSNIAADSPAIYQRNRPNKKRRWLYLGVSSTASFNVRVAAQIKAFLGNEDNDDELTFTLDGDAYKVSWNRIRSDEVPDLSDLPSIDYATYLMNTVKFHLDSLLRLYDEEEFMHLLHEFYANAARTVQSNRLWFAQYLLIMALGKGLLNAKGVSGSLPGSEFFCRAMAVLPELSALHEDPVLAVEVLCSVALYFYCLDMRQTAYSYIGQALRIALVEGNHTYLHGSQLGEKLAKRCANVWWTGYILDRTLSSVVGVPPSVNDKHIRNALPTVKQSSQRDATLGLHVKLSRLISDILTELYSADGSLETSYLTKVRSVLRDMAQVGEEIEETIDFKFKNSLETVSKGATHLRLMFHQCIILATRPLLLCLLQDKLKPSNMGRDEQLNVLPSVQDLLQTCAESATKTLKMLAALSRNNMLDSFLPFDLDFACSAASILVLVNDCLQCLKVDHSAQRLIDKLLDEMISAGSSAASLRKKELTQLRRLAHRMRTKQVPFAELPTASSLSYETEEIDTTNQAEQRETSHGSNDPNTSPLLTFANEILTPVLSSTTNDLAQNFDLSYEQMLSVADQLDVNAFPANLDFNEFGRLDWLELDL